MISVRETKKVRREMMKILFLLRNFNIFASSSIVEVLFLVDFMTINEGEKNLIWGEQMREKLIVYRERDMSQFD